MKRKTEKRFPAKLVVSVLALLLIIGGAAEFYHHIEGWDRLDSAYFSVITFTTIGYGDKAPETKTGKIGTIFFSLLGVIITFHFLFLIGNYLFERKISVEERHIKRKFKEEELKKSKPKKKKKKSKK